MNTLQQLVQYTSTLIVFDQLHMAPDGFETRCNTVFISYHNTPRYRTRITIGIFTTNGHDGVVHGTSNAVPSRSRTQGQVPPYHDGVVHRGECRSATLKSYAGASVAAPHWSRTQGRVSQCHTWSRTPGQVPQYHTVRRDKCRHAMDVRCAATRPVAPKVGPSSLIKNGASTWRSHKLAGGGPEGI